MMKFFLTFLFSIIAEGVLFSEKTAYDGEEAASIGSSYVSFNGQTYLHYKTLIVNQLEEFTMLCWFRVDGS